jgi:phosphoribosylamine--glycine ligase
VRILVVGGGGREHAIAWKLKRDDPDLDLHAAPGNAGIAELATCHSLQSSDLDAVVTLAIQGRFDLTIIGPETPLAGGVVDRLMMRGLRAFGPTAAAAHVESSKRFAKELLLGAGVPTAQASWHEDTASAKESVRQRGAPVVIKASGLASGKGVIVCESVADADRAIDDMLTDHRFGHSGDVILVEEFMEGEELSMFFLSDGLSWRPMLPAQDHKRLLDGDAGPNTGGMGAYAPVSLASDALVRQVEDTIVAPTLRAMRQAGAPFRGLLYVGLMLTKDGPRVVEFNCRFGDPETQVVLPLLESPLLDLLVRCTSDNGLDGIGDLRFREGAAVTTVVAAPGYPDEPRIGDPIDLSGVSEDVILFHAGTRRSDDGNLVTAGGRVLGVTAIAPTLEEAQARSRDGAAAVNFPGRQFRQDIGWREQQRRAGAP